MAVKKAIPVVKAPVKPKRFEEGYQFPVMATIVSVCKGDQYPYEVEVELDSEGDIDGVRLSFSKEGLLRFELESYPSSRKSILQEQLAEAKASVVELTKQIAAIK